MLCAVCFSQTEQSYVNPVFIGRPHVFCWYCYLAWYEEGLSSESGIRRRSLALRYDDRVSSAYGKAGA